MYQCKDCSYRGARSSQGGQCPACGSFNISAARNRQEKAPPGKLRLLLLLALWSYLIVHIIWKLYH